MIFLETERLIVRNWRPDDAEALFALYGDAEVMRFFPRTYPMEECRRRVARWGRCGREEGMAFAPVERKAAPGMIGYVGLFPIDGPGLPARGGHEIGWMIARAHWRQGHAREAAIGWLDHAFAPAGLGLERVVAFTAAINGPSRAVMRAIGMERVAQGDFDHPNVETDSPLRRHVLYEARAGSWRRPG